LKYWEVRAKAEKTGELLLYGDIASAQIWGDEITPKQIDADLKALGEIDTLNVYVNSGGGSVFSGMAIYNIIKRFNASEKNAYVDGLAASIASVIPMACDKVYIPANAMMMIHNPSAIARGNAADFRQMADTLDKVRESMLAVYREKTGMTDDELIPMLDAETWMTASDAIEKGFADELQEEKRIAASIDGGFLIYGDVKVDTAAFKNFKPETVEMYRAETETPEPVADNDPEPPDLATQDADFNRIRLKLLGGNQE
jgi:ATP-dependent Clp protease protease subunit